MNSRRDFLQKLGLTALALHLAPVSGWTESVHHKAYDGPVLRIAIMGLGSYGERVAEAMRACTKAKLVGVISGTPSKIKIWQSRYGIPEKTVTTTKILMRSKTTRISTRCT